jgi:hypothetical protein
VGSSEPVLGADVRFVPVYDADTGKVYATEVQVLPAGTAVFEVVGDEVFEGTVKIVPGLPRGDMPGPKGVIIANVGGQMETLPFGSDVVIGSMPGLHAKVRRDLY